MNKIEQLLGANWSYHTPVHNHSLFTVVNIDHDLSLSWRYPKPWSLLQEHTAGKGFRTHPIATQQCYNKSQFPI